MDTYIVYVQVDENGNTIAVNSSAFLRDTTGWTPIDEGVGDRYHHAQWNYFDGGVYTDDGIPRFKIVDGSVLERTQAEINADRASGPPTPPSVAERLEATEAAILALMEVLG